MDADRFSIASTDGRPSTLARASRFSANAGRALASSPIGFLPTSRLLADIDQPEPR